MVMPGSAAAVTGDRMPSLVRNLRPMSAVSCAEVAMILRTALMMATGSPATLALGTIGNVVSHRPPSVAPPGDVVPRSQGAPDAGPVPGCAALGAAAVAATGRAASSRA